MKPFWSRKAEPPLLAERLAQIEAELAKVQTELRALELEQVNMHKQVKTWLRRGVMAERNQERGAMGRAAATPATSKPTGAMWGPNARMLARASSSTLVETVEPELELTQEVTNGLHP